VSDPPEGAARQHLAGNSADSEGSLWSTLRDAVSDSLSDRVQLVSNVHDRKFQLSLNQDISRTWIGKRSKTGLFARMSLIRTKKVRTHLACLQGQRTRMRLQPLHSRTSVQSRLWVGYSSIHLMASAS